MEYCSKELVDLLGTDGEPELLHAFIEILSGLTISQRMSIMTVLDSVSLSLCENIPDGWSESNVALLLASATTSTGLDKYVSEFFDSYITKWEPVETNENGHFAHLVCKKITSIIEDPRLKTHYFFIEIATRTGDIENEVVRLISCESHEAESIPLFAAQEAMKCNQGRFDETFYGRPCFDNSGFISYVNDIKEIAFDDYEVLCQFIRAETGDVDCEDEDICSYVNATK